MVLRRLLYFIILTGCLISSCASAPQTPIRVRPSVTSQAIATKIPSTATPRPTQPGITCFRPYSKFSIWNTPVDWSTAKIHPQSEAMISAFFKDYSWIGSDTSQYSANLYFVNNNTPLVTVELQFDRSFRDASSDTTILYGEPGGRVQVPLPINARPAPGTDGELAVVNIDTGDEWGLVNGRVLGSGLWSAGGLYRYNIRNSGIPPSGFAQRGAGIGSFAGLVRPCEVERGYIGHAVTIAYDYPCASEICQANNWPSVIPPFTKSDGMGTDRFDIPEGAHLVIKPEITKAEILKACSGIQGCIVWVQNMQEYGGYVVDDSGHPKTYAEGDATANWDKNIWSPDMLRNIPPNWYAVLDWRFSQASGQ